MNVEFKTGFLGRIFWLIGLNITVIISLIFITSGAIISLIPILIAYTLITSLISLLRSKGNVKKAYNLLVLEENERYDDNLEWYRNLVISICNKAQMEKLPEIAIYESSDKNAFATGYSKKNSLVAVSTALLYEMSDDAIEAVIAHEISHIMNGDMVTQILLDSTLRLVVGVVVLPITFFKWIMYFVSDASNEFMVYIVWFIEFIVATIMLFLSSLLVKAYSRRREFKADHLASQLTAPEKMVQALSELSGATLLPTQKKYAALQFNGVKAMFDLFSTHPSLERRIKYINKQFNN